MCNVRHSYLFFHRPSLQAFGGELVATDSTAELGEGVGNGVACESWAVEEHKTSAAGSADLAAAGTGLTCSVVDGVDAGIADPVALDVPAVVCCVGFAIRHILLLGFLIRFIFVMIVN